MIIASMGSSDVMVMCNCNRLVMITHSLVIVIVIGKLEHDLIGNRNCNSVCVLRAFY